MINIQHEMHNVTQAQALKVYNESVDQAWKIYEPHTEILAKALKMYVEVEVQTSKEYEIYKKTIDLARKIYEGAEDAGEAILTTKIIDCPTIDYLRCEFYDIYPCPWCTVNNPPSIVEVMRKAVSDYVKAVDQVVKTLKEAER